MKKNTLILIFCLCSINRIFSNDGILDKQVFHNRFVPPEMLFVDTRYSADTFYCGMNITVNHTTLRQVAPVNKTVTYGTVTGIPGEEAKCWITQNLGAGRQALAVDDSTEESAGWYWQFNCNQGYKHSGTTRTPNTPWLTQVSLLSEWLPLNDPCGRELNSSWRLPTGTEWGNTIGNGGWTNWNGPWNSNLKMNAAGFMNSINGGLSDRGSAGHYWMNQYVYGTWASNVTFSSGSCGTGSGYLTAYGYSLRCIKSDTCSVFSMVDVSITPSANPACEGSMVTFTATPANGGSAPQYQWKVNGNDAGGATGITYSYKPTNGDRITCVLISDVACKSTNLAISNVITMAVNLACAQAATFENDWDPYPNVEEAPTTGYTLLDSLEFVPDSYYYRVRGYLVPPETGYYRFHLLSSTVDCFNLSLDSMEYHKRAIVHTEICWPLVPKAWPDTLPQTNDPCVGYNVDSVYLIQQHPYYFDIITQWNLANRWNFGLRWTLPGTNHLTTIKNGHLKPPIPKHLGSEPVREIFENEFTCDFNELKNKTEPPDQKTSLHTMTTWGLPNSLDYYSSRTRGYIYPEVSGNYSFYFACDEAGQFWLSPDSTEAGAQLKSNVPSPQPDWKQHVSSQYLEAQHKYFFEVLQHDSIGTDFFKLGWGLQGDTLPTVISFTCLSNSLVSAQVDSVWLTRERISLMPGKMYAAIAQVRPWNAPNCALLWFSTDNAVAYPDGNGLITAVTPGTCRIIARLASNPALADTLDVNVSLLYLDLYKDRMSVNFDSLKNSGEIPDERVGLSGINTPEHLSSLDHFASRLMGYIVTPVSGNYTFFMGCDDKGEFWLSTDSTRANAQVKIAIDSSTYDWAPVTASQYLESGHKYFFELLQYDSIYRDRGKIGWIFPGDTAKTVIGYPYILGVEDAVPVSGIFLRDHSISAYPGCLFTPCYTMSPWNAADQQVKWLSSDNAIASVTPEGVITTQSAGNCRVILSSTQDSTVFDTVHVSVTNLSGPFFVKQNAPDNGDGQSWDNPIPFTKLLNYINQSNNPPHLNVFVAEGTYKPTTGIDRNKTFLCNNLRVTGGFASNISGTDTVNRDFDLHETILSGEIGDPLTTMDNSFHVVITRGTVTLDGLTIRDGRANSKAYGDDNWYYFLTNRGGGILAQAAKTIIYNCKIQNNSAWDVAGGIALDGGQLVMQHCQVTGNLMQQTLIIGGMFSVYSNGYGAGMRLMGTSQIKDCLFMDNLSWFAAQGSALASVDGPTVTTIENCTFDRNFSGSHADLFNYQGSTINLKNSTLKGSVLGLGWTNTNVINSTIIGGTIANFEWDHFYFDNSICTNPSLPNSPSQPDNGWQARYSILGDNLYGAGKDSILMSNLPSFNTWLDTVAFNGGTTPTMKLKNIPANPAKTHGNPAYLGTTDQRGITRNDTVSIGAYQWVWPSQITISPDHANMAPGDSLSYSVLVLPAWADDKTWSAAASDSNIVAIAGNTLMAQSEGNARVMVRTHEGNRRDTSFVMVMIDSVGVNGIVHNGNSNCYSALDVITVAGNGNSFLLQAGGISEMIAGQKIRYLPGTTVKTGGFMHGYIAPQGPWCNNSKSVAGNSQWPENDPHGVSLSTGNGFFKAWPNPTSGLLHLAINTGDVKTTVQTTIFSFLGEIVFRDSFTGVTTTSILLEGLLPGMYLVQVVQGSRSEVVKVVRQ
ncbi:MAG: T9SS type A sorting domain-containing protein [Bacteroidetes bacterium]|nr:T9SS type A sorting domain-containing protein [Bacteroidota bacterium]